VLTQVTFRRNGSVFLNDGIYGSLSEYNLPNWPARYPLTVYSRGEHGHIVIKSGVTQGFRIFGPTCDTLDKLPIQLDLPASLEAGDWVLFGQMGAYSSALRTAFNGYYPDTFAMVNDH
jgi:ornithine decarboxylase